MNYNKKTVMDVDVAGKKILLRCDFNVPQDKKTGAITSDKRIVAALPTIRYLLERGAAVIACSHLGKPNATFASYVKKQVEKGKNVTTATLEYAEEVGADLIAIMTEQEKSLTSLFLGTYAQQMINESKIPVLTVRPRSVLANQD